MAPLVPMRDGNGGLALWQPLPTRPPSPGVGENVPSLSALPGLSGWWDGATFNGMRDRTGSPLTSWGSEVFSLQDQSGNGRAVIPYTSRPAVALPIAAPRLSGLLGGLGSLATNAGLPAPVLDPDAGLAAGDADLQVETGWTLFLVWSRPNWRQNSGKDAEPVTLLSWGGAPVLQAESRGGGNRLWLFPGSGADVILTADLARRHTHSLIIRNRPNAGVDVWLDDNRIVSAGANPLVSLSGTLPLILLHDTTVGGGAQCWFHEAAMWTRDLADQEIGIVLTRSSRWSRGSRRGVCLLINGQSNAINFSLNDGAAELLAQGVAWHLGALAYDILATWGGPSSYTMQSGHGIYRAGLYPGSFLQDPGDGSDPLEWQPGADGEALREAISNFPDQDRSDLCAIVWPWNETDSLRDYSEKARFMAAARRFLSLERAMAGLSADKLPLIWWNAISYGLPGGMQMHREVVATLANDPGTNVVIGNPQTSDTNARGSAWDPSTGIATGGDPAHRDGADNQRLARLAAPVVARALMSAGRGDTMVTIPPQLPISGGPRIVQARAMDETTLMLTVLHDAGDDLKVPLRAAQGAGFTVMDGGNVANPGPLVEAVSCERLDQTHLQIRLSQPLNNPPERCLLFYPYGSQAIGRGNAVTDNYSQLPKPAGWDISGDLGTAWNLDYPLAATTTGIPVTPG